MIGRLRGIVLDRTSSSLIVDVHDVGYLVSVSGQCRAGVGERVDLHIYTHVRDDAIQLYGFTDATERELFDLLITVPSVGPVKALGILATPADEIVRYVMEKSSAKLSKLPGVGKKTAERIVLDLYDKVAAIAPRAPAPAGALGVPGSAVLDDLVSALTNLGFRPAVAGEAARSAVDRLGDAADLETLLRDALLQAGGR